MGRPVVSAIVYDKRGRILSAAQNSYERSHPIMLRAAKATKENEGKIYLHAEVAALLKCDWTKAHSIYVSRFTKDGKPALAKPCKCCEFVINLTAIRQIGYTQ